MNSFVLSEDEDTVTLLLPDDEIDMEVVNV